MPGPKRINPDIRYAQEIMLWRMAEYCAVTLVIEQPTAKQAINLRHRLNTCRAVYRDMSAGAWLEWDSYTVKLNDRTITIEPKEAVDLSKVYALKDDGRTQLSTTDIMIADSEGSPIPSWQPTPPTPGAIQPSFSSQAREKAEMAKIYEQTRPKGPDIPVYKGHSGVFPKMPLPPETFDPNAPLDLEESE